MTNFNVYKDGHIVVTVLKADSYEQAFDIMKQQFSSFNEEDKETWSIIMCDGTRYSLIQRERLRENTHFAVLLVTTESLSLFFYSSMLTLRNQSK